MKRRGERRSGALIGIWREAFNCEITASNHRRVTPVSVSIPGEKLGGGRTFWHAGPTCRWGGRGIRVLVRVWARWAAGCFSYWAESFPGVLFLFSFLFFFFFYFLISFVSSAKMLQINSNHFQKFSKNQCNDLTLQEN
jgi:hypothetical protein